MSAKSMRVRRTSQRVIARPSKMTSPQSIANELQSRKRQSACALSLLTYGYRGWMGGLRSADMSAWENVFRTYSQELGLCHAKRTVEALSEWVSSIEHARSRRVEVCPLEARALCRDECVAMSIVAAAQSDACPAMRACAFALVGADNIDPVVSNAEALATEFRDAERIFEPSLIVPSELAVAAQATSYGCATH
ncbi:MAG: hypothetical protein AAFR23_06410 [Pseudomonadota bacterium]